MPPYMIAFGGIFLEYSHKKFSKNHLNFLKNSLYYLVKVCVLKHSKYVLFKVFQIHVQVF